MDPTSRLAQVYSLDSFARTGTNEAVDAVPPLDELLPESFGYDDEAARDELARIRSRQGLKAQRGALPAVYEDSEDWLALQDCKAKFADYDGETLRKAVEETNNYEKISFPLLDISRAALKLANLDALENLTGLAQDSLRPTSTAQFFFCDVAGGPGGFTQYLQYRSSQAEGYGITLDYGPRATKGQQSLAWTTKKLDMVRFKIYDRGNGNLYTEWRGFAEAVRQSYGSVSLVVSDGGIGLDKDFEMEETLHVRLLLAEVAVALSVLTEGGHFVMKLFDARSRVMIQLLYILSLVFRQIRVYKPRASRPANAERYLVAKNFRKDLAIQALELVAPALDGWAKLGEGLSISRLFDDTPEEEASDEPDIDLGFIDWLLAQNADASYYQLSACGRVHEYLQQGHTTTPITEVSAYRVLLNWGLPSIGG